MSTDDKAKEAPIYAHADVVDNFHPYECRGPKECIHCKKEKSDVHDPARCALCRDGDFA